MKVCRLTLLLTAAAIASISTSAQAQDAEGEIVYAPGTGYEDAAPLPADADDGSRDRFEETGEGMTAVADQLSDPATQNRLSDVVEGVTGALMQMRIGPFAEAIEHVAPGTVDRRIRRDTTLGDLAGGSERALPERFGQHSREALAAMGGTMHALAAMMPELQRLGDEVKDSARAAREHD